MLTKLEMLHDIAHNANINIHDFKFSETKKAACVLSGDYKAIALDKNAITSKAEEIEVLAEEIAHYEMGALYMVTANFNHPLAKQNRLKYEAQARRRAIEHLVSPQKIECAYRAECGIWHEMAERCSVTPEFLDMAVQHYRSMGVKFSFDDGNEYDYP